MSPEQDCFERISVLWGKLNSSPKGQAALKNVDQVIHFELKESEAFHMEVKGGRAAIAKGKAASVPLEQNLLIRTDAATLNSMLERKLSLGDAIYERKLWVYGNVLKGPAIAWFFQLLRLKA